MHENTKIRKYENAPGWLRTFVISCFLVFAAQNANAKPLIADMSDYRIAIDSQFTGKRMLLFGTRNDPGDIIVVIRGPERNITIRKKEQVFGIWMNAEQVQFLNVPHYYAITGTRLLHELSQSPIYRVLGIGLENIEFTPPKPLDPVIRQEFVEAYRALQIKQNLYNDYQQPVTFMGETLFKTTIPFPDNLPRGNYAVDIYLFEDGILRGMQSLPIQVKKVGFDALVYGVAHKHPLLYGVLAVIIAVGVGWTVSFISNKVW